MKTQELGHQNNDNIENVESGKYRWLLSAAIVVTLVFFAGSDIFGISALWGANHLQFLPQGYFYVFGVISLLTLLSLFRPLALLDAPAIDIEDRMWRIIISLGAGVLFYLLQIETYLLGDGYTWLSNLGQGENYIHKWTEPGSIYLIRNLQALFGGYTEGTALLAFQALSIFSGVVVCYCLLGIATLIAPRGNLRALFVITVLFSGSALLFAGYVEFYPALWAAATAFLYQVFRYFRERKGLWLVLLSYLLCVLMHLQVLYFAPAVLYLIFEKLSYRFAWRISVKGIWITLSVLALLFCSSYFWLSANYLEFEVIFLPFFEGRPGSPQYAVFTLSHLLDVLNLALLCFPGFIFLIALTFSRTPKNPTEIISTSPVTICLTTTFLALSAFGSVLFLMMVDPVLGLARDWDLFSLTLLAPALLLFVSLHRVDDKRLGSLIVPYALVCALGSGLYLATNVSRSASEDRFESLLNHYGAKERHGWGIFANYLRDSGDLQRRERILIQRGLLFPSERALDEFNEFLQRGNYQSALLLAQGLYRSDPYSVDFQQALGNVFGRMSVFDSSDFYFQQALRLRPHNSILLKEYGRSLMAQGRDIETLEILKKAHYYEPSNESISEGMGLTYYKMNLLDSTTMVAESLFELDSNSAGAHLLSMLVASQAKKREVARFHFLEYKKYGIGRGDYQKIVARFDFLDE